MADTNQTIQLNREARKVQSWIELPTCMYQE